MAKTKNITPEDREQAISTIEKVGEQVTDERIEHYIQLRRNTIKHQEEKENKENGANALDAKSNKKFIRISKIMTLITLGVVVMTFINSGFSFTIGWYLVVIILLVLAFVFYVEGNDSSQEALNDGDSLLIKSATIVSLSCAALLWIWGPLNPNYSSGESHNSYNMPTEHNTEPCDKCGSVGTYYIAEDGTRTGDRRYSWGHRKYCYGCYKEMENFNNALKRSNSPYADYSH